MTIMTRFIAVICCVTATVAAQTGCIKIKSLAPTIEAHQRNLNELSKNVAVSNRLNELFIEATVGVYLRKRLSVINNDFTVVLGRPEELLAVNVTWDILFAKKRRYKTGYDELTAAKMAGLSDEQRLKLSQKYGWIFSAVFDLAFTPDKAKQMQQTLTGLRARYLNDNPDQFADIATDLLQPYDGQLHYRAETTAGLRLLREALAVDLYASLRRGDKLNEAMLRAAETDISIAKTLGAISGSEEAKQLINGLAKKHIGDEHIRGEVLNLFSDLAGSITN